MSRAVLAAFVLGCAAAVLAQGMPKTVLEGKREVLPLDPWASPAGWGRAECSVRAAKKRLANGRPTLHMHVPIDHFAGEKRYPIGWPRIGMNMKLPWEKDWTGFEHFEFMVYTETSRDKLPKTPVTLILYCPTRHRAWHRSLHELRKGQWVKFSLPIARMRYVEGVARMQFSISESNYKHGDQVHFYIGGFRFVRSTECRLADLAIRNPALFQGQPTLGVEIEVEGVPKSISRAVPFTIRRGETVVRQESLPVHRGRYTLPIDISELKLAPGAYTLEAFAEDAGRRRSGTFRVVASPWKGE